MTNWKINSLDSLALSDQVELHREQVGDLPTGLQKQICDRYSRALNIAFPENLPGNQTPQFRTGENGHLYVQINGDERDVGIDPEFRKAIRKVSDFCRVQYPEMFKGAPRGDFPGVEAPAPDAPQGTAGWLYDQVQTPVVNDMNSMWRNWSTVAGAISTTAAAASLFVGGLGGAYVSGKIFKAGYHTYKEAVRVGDAEGKSYGKMRMALGGTFGVAASSMATTGVSTLANVGSVSALAGIAIAGNIGLFAMGASMLYGAWKGARPLLDFRKELKLILNNHDLSAPDKAKRGLEFLRSQYTLTRGEAEELADRYTEEGALEIAIEHKISEKWATLVRRVGEDAAKKIVRETEDLLTKLNADDLTVLDQAVALLQLSDKMSFTTGVKLVMMFLLGLFYAALGVLSTVALFSPISPLILPISFAIGAMLWLTLDSDRVGNGAGKFFWNSHHKDRWNIRNANFKEEMINCYRKNGRWDLDFLRNHIEGDLNRGSKIKINGEEISDFKALIQRLRLENVHFNQNEVEEAFMTAEEKKALEFLVHFQQGFYADATGYAMRKTGMIPINSHSGKYKATFDATTGMGTVSAKMPFQIRDLDGNTVTTLNVKTYFDGNVARIYTK